jgi:hypothetical protein
VVTDRATYGYRRLWARMQLEVLDAIGIQAGNHASHQPAEQRHGRELRQNLKTRLPQIGLTAGLTIGDGTTDQMVRRLQFLLTAKRIWLLSNQAVQGEMSV